MQWRPTRDDDPQQDAGVEQLADELPGREQVFEVVQDQQKLAVRDVSAEMLQQRSARESCSPMLWAIETGTRAGSFIAASDTKWTPAGKSSATAVATAIANLVLPQPPAPVNVINLARSKS